eukprot:sb/3468538/
MGYCKGGCMIGPSILNADLSRLTEECQRLLDAGADYLHLDVMDGLYVSLVWFGLGHSSGTVNSHTAKSRRTGETAYCHTPPLSGAPVVACLRDKFPGVTFEVHMMVSNPDQWIDDFAKAGADIYTFHIEASSDPAATVQKIKDAGMKPGCGIKPKTEVEPLSTLAPSLDVCLVMTVEPGFGGQKFMSDMMSKVEFLRKNHPDSNIEVDGGLSPATIEQAARAGANMIVSGSAVVKAPDAAVVITELRNVVKKWRSQ